MKNIFLVIIYFFSSNLYSESNISQNHVCRAAFDIGSGKIGLQVAKVDTKTGKIAELLYADLLRVPLILSLTKDGKFSEEIQEKTLLAIGELKAKASSYNPEEYSAIATEAFRISSNGKEFALKIQERLAIPVHIITQDEEGILAFLTASSFANIDLENAIVYDQGGGSFQVTCKENGSYLTYSGKLGKVSTKLGILEIQKKDPVKDFSPNPVSSKEKNRAIQFVQDQIHDIPEIFLKKLKKNSNQAIGIGGHPQTILSRHLTYHIEEVASLLDETSDLNDKTIIDTYHYLNTYMTPEVFAAHAVAELILTYGVMSRFGIQTIDYVETLAGSTAGILISEKYWKSPTSAFPNTRLPELLNECY